MKEYARDWWSRISVTDRRRLVTVAIKYQIYGSSATVIGQPRIFDNNHGYLTKPQDVSYGNETSATDI